MITLDDVHKLAESYSDIQFQLERLYVLAFGINNKNKIIVELGTRYGNSTTALIAAVNDSGGHFYSIDVMKWIDFSEEKNFTFILGDDMEVIKNWDKKIDFLFIDTSHIYEHTLNELNQQGSFVVKGGFITLHDTNQAGVMDAIKEYLLHNEYSFENFEESNGLGVLIKK